MALSPVVGRATLLAFFSTALCSPAVSQSPSMPPAEDASSGPAEYGTTSHFVTIVDAYEFNTLDSTTTRETGFGTVYPLNGLLGGATLGASVNRQIPNGAVITSMCLVGYDNAPGAGDNLEVTLIRYVVDVIGGANPAINGAASVSSSGAPQEFLACANNLNIPFLPRYDFSGDGDIEYVDFRLHADFGDDRDVYGNQMQLRFVRLTWQRLVSPGPPAATFADVPTSHPFFRFVEALVASGITAGCGGGSYCVDQPLTRGEMAVFLAVALGLHWPPF